MRKGGKKRWVLIAIFFTIFITVSHLWADSKERCIVCGMYLSKYAHTRYVVETREGKTCGTCGVQCGLTLHLRLGEKWKGARATDFFSKNVFDAEEGYYVFNSSVITDMAPGFIAFSQKADAVEFAEESGGQVVTYEEAIKIWEKQMQ